MLKVRLQRVGRRNDPSFRVVVIDSKKGPKSRNYIEMLGSYN
ncbi:MAG: 30S ribosomal protein S16, partial [Proteobacteria bacterium]|nr:30S ribosomal protein S16 [Pseudomonadota bacterium]